MNIFFYESYIITYLITLYFFIYINIFISLISNNNVIRLLFLFEILIFLIGLIFLFIGFFHNDIYGQVVILFLLTVAAVEASVGLAILYVYYKFWRLVKLSNLIYLKG